MQSNVYTGTEHREWLLFAIRVNPSLIHNNTCFEVMQTATFITKTYLNIFYFFLKLTRLFTLSYAFSFEGESSPLNCHFPPLGPMITNVYNMGKAVKVYTLHGK